MVEAERILDFIRADLIDDDEVEVDATTSLFDSRVLDSIQLLSLLSFLEKTYGRKIPTQDVSLENFDTVDRMLGYLNGPA